MGFVLFDSEIRFCGFARSLWRKAFIFIYERYDSFVASEKESIFQLPLRYISPLRKNAYSQLISAEEYIFDGSSLNVKRHQIFNFPPGCQMNVIHRLVSFFKARNVGIN